MDWLSFLGIILWCAVYGGLFSLDFLGHAKGDKLVAFNKGIEHKGLSYVLITLFAGIIAGFGMAKSGFGTECALVSVEAGAMIKKDEEKFTKWGLPRITKTLFKGLLPIQGVTVAWIITLGGIYSSGGFLVTNMVLAEV